MADKNLPCDDLNWISSTEESVISFYGKTAVRETVALQPIP